MTARVEDIIQREDRVGAIPWPLTTLISGGQDGADRAGLVVGRALGYTTGGLVPRGCRTERGPAPELVTIYGCVESRFSSYTPRTLKNVQSSDGSVIFGDVTSAGTKATIENCRVWQKPYLENPSAVELRDWIRAHRIRVLNCAGNRASTNPEIFDHVVAVLTEALAR